MLKKKSITIILLLLIGFFAKAQDPTTMGTDFWVSFPFINGHPSPDLYLEITSLNGCTGTISNPATGYNVNFSIAAGQYYEVQLNANDVYNLTNGSVNNKGLHIVTTDTVSVLATCLVDNSNYATFDVSFVLPTEVLLDNYIVQTYESAINPNGPSSPKWYSVCLVVATEDATVVDVIPSTNTSTGWNANTSYSIMLNAGQCYELRASDIGTTLSGTHIQSRDCKKIAVFGAHECAYIPNGQGASCDHLFEQIVPVPYWGMHFVCTMTNRHNGDEYLVTSASDNCTVSRNGTVVATLNMGDTYRFTLNNSNVTCFLETSAPCIVYSYMQSKNVAGPDGDPSMTFVAPIEQQIKDVVFMSKSTPKVQYHYVNVVTKTSNVNNVSLDGNSIASQFGPVISNPAFSYARVSVSQGYHRLKSTGEEGFVAHAYGVGSNVSYSYAVGFQARPNAPDMVINDSVYKADSIEVAICEGGLLFSIAGVDVYDSIVWSKNGGEYTTSDSVFYVFGSPGVYSVCAVVSSNGGSCRAKVDTICATIHVKGVSYDTLAVDTCEGVYWWRNNGYRQSGVYSDTIQGPDGCDSILSLALNFHPAYSFSLDTILNQGETYTWIDGVIYSEPTSASYELLSQYGCDSVYHLNLRYHEVKGDIWAPNVFTPEENTNKTFQIKGVAVGNVEVVIYNRWGDFVYRWEGLDGYWDGTRNGEKCKSDAYVYQVSYVDGGNNKKTQIGTVTLLR